ncbi:UNVERIFIED_CONTAM: hypothetical protein FKN15_078095 [Acipenser sinensis]
MDSDVETMQQSIEDLKGACDPLYLPDPDPARIPINRNLSRKSGYLNCRKSAILQAESRKDCEEWIATINNISKQIYLSENPEETAARVNQSALDAVTPSPSFQQRHESLRPAAKSRPKASHTSSSDSASLSTLSLNSLVAPDTPIQFDIISPVSEEYAGQAKLPGQTGRTNPFGESGDGKPEETKGECLGKTGITGIKDTEDEC